MKYLYRVCWVRPYYALLGLLGLCVLTVVISLLFLEDAALKLPHTRLQAASGSSRGAQALPLQQHLRERGDLQQGEGDSGVIHPGGGGGTGGGAGGVKYNSFRSLSKQKIEAAAAADMSKDSAAAAVQRQAWPDHKKDPRRIAAGLAGGIAAGGGGGEDNTNTNIKVLNNLEIVVQNLSVINQHHPHQQKESARLGVRIVNGDIIIPPTVLSARADPSLNSSSSSSHGHHRQRYIIYLCTGNMTCCGWGDRQHGILSAYLISLVTNRTFGVEMTSPCPLSVLFHPRIINWKLNMSSLAGLSSRHIYSVNDIVFRQVMQVVDFDGVYPEDVVYLTTNYDYFYALKSNPHYTQLFRRQLHGKPRPLIFANLWQNIFKLNKRVTRRIDQALRLAHPTPHHKLVCGHVRLGKNPSIPNDSEVRNTLHTIRPLWNFLAHFRDPKKYRIFVPSDSEVVREKVLDMFPGQAVDVKGDIFHIDKSRVVDDACVGFEKVLADQYLLSTCDVLVLTYSVFGKSAAYMRRSNKDLYFMENGVINPLQLFKEKAPPH